MLKKSASGVLASLRGSTYRSVRLASSLAAALLDSLSEHPEVVLNVRTVQNRSAIWLASTKYSRSPVEDRDIVIKGILRIQEDMTGFQDTSY